MSQVRFSLLAAALCGLVAGQRSAHVAPTLEERAALRRGPCEVGWTLSEERCFRLSPVAAAWDEARQLCSQQRPSARLAYAVTPSDQLLVQALWREAVRTQPAVRRQEAALWIDPAAGLERTSAALRDGYGALGSSQVAVPVPEAVSDESAVIVDAGGESAVPPEPLCPSLTADVTAARETGHTCDQKLLYVCELDTVDLNMMDV
ncbi:hypothetical protein FJT64_009891 [Amphibalanus amphitrite]|uniref:C-type lectin domain-containing protein n=1 Tax=Amphibalanus amphitrite TaxID=1232801 RepID=A0A6A4VG02_AMPAM|nr:hypothetical protein FJT64_009891 [Amphibalanus amphitrite]